MKLNYQKLFVLVLFIGCNNVSTESEKPIVTVSTIKAHITITEDLSKESIRAEAHLYDKEGKEYSSDKITLFVNNQKLEHWANSTNYYSKRIQYALNNVVPAGGYRVELQLANDSLALLGYVRAIPKIDLSEALQIPETFNNYKDYSFSWENIKPLNELEVMVSQKDTLTMRNLKGTVIARFEKINSKKGSYTIQASQFRDSIFLGTRMNIKFNGSTNGLIDPNLIVGSFCQAKLIFQKKIPVDSNNK